MYIRTRTNNWVLSNEIFFLLENCLLIRLHKYEGFGYSTEFHNDVDDGYVPSTIRGLHTVLKLEYDMIGDGVRLYDSANQFARFQKYSHPTAEEKMTNFYFLLDSLARSSKERLSLLQGFRDNIEHWAPYDRNKQVLHRL